MRNIGKYNYNLLKRIKKPKTLFLLSLIMLTVLSTMYIRYTWYLSINTTSQQALKSARIAAVSLNGEMIKKLSGVKQDFGTIAHESIKKRLTDLVSIEEGINRAYIFIQRDEKIYFVVDSEPVDSKSRPGEEYIEATDEDKKLFIDGNPIITKPLTDNWGTWVSILVPIKDNKTGKTIAVLGIDYPVKTWNDNARKDAVQAGIIIFVLFLLLATFYIIVNKNEKMIKSQTIIKESEEKYRLLITQMQQGVAVYEVILDEAEKIVDYRFIDANESFERVTGFKAANIIEKTGLKISSETKGYWIDKYSHLAMTGEPIRIEDYSKELDKYFEVVAYFPQPKQVAVIVTDITERKKVEQEILYLSYYDQLTGLYNRRFYEEELKRLDTKRNLPMTLVMGDVNGLKLINDSFGHAAGDELLKKVSEVIKKGCRADDIIARLGGDEFVILLPNTDAVEAEQIIKRIKSLALKEKVESIDISISFGYETKHNEEIEIKEIFKKAEDYMYKKKLFESQSMRGKTISSIITTLHEKNKREEQHSNRVSELCKSIGIALELSEDEIMELKTVGLFHDIGKIAIDENLLNNTGKLTDDEWEQIKRHSEIGYRILCTANDMSEIAGYVLAHHERWDGKGYPKGLKEEEIPFVSRIIAIADSYDAMTSERSYQSVLSEQAAIEVLRKNAGVKFDPELVSVFIEKVLGKSQ